MSTLKSFIAVPRRRLFRSLKQLRAGWQTLREGPAVLVESSGPAQRPGGLVVLDDVYPLPWSGFRVAEFNAYLDAFDDAEVHSSGDRLFSFGSRAQFADIVDEYSAQHPGYRGRILKFHPWRGLSHKGAAYSLFVGTTHRYVKTLERYRVPFIFTLYPGGGFALDDPRSDAMLRAIFGSKVFRKVIATQSVTRDYLVSRGLCDPGDIELVYGGVFRSDELASEPLPHARYGLDKASFDICFVAHKYMPQGRDKGYDRFIATAKLLAARFDDVHFHVVGPFSDADVPIHGLEGRLTFYGNQATTFFRGFYARMDAILSPNLPFVLRKGAFDGFPTGSCMEAGMCGVAVFCTDTLKLNVALRDGEEVVVIPSEPDEIANVLAEYRAAPERLAQLGAAAAARFPKLFGVEEQMPPRLRLLSNLLAAPGLGRP